MYKFLQGFGGVRVEGLGFGIRAEKRRNDA